ncbi:NAD(P)-binding protein [Whalleya microplaca]|nr:NAD(P)-binding protein [Whalleya microplaca]
MSAIFKQANTAVITGGASGIGLALAQKCIGYGMKVLVADWDAANLDAAQQSLGENASKIQVDVSKPEDWERVKKRVGEEFGGRINLLSLNAGISRPTSFSDPATAPAFAAILQTNLFGIINGLTSLLPLITTPSPPSSSPSPTSSSPGNPTSAIIITGSKQGITNPPGNPAYNASKAAVKTLAEHLAFDLRDRPDIAVHLLVPGWTWTPLAGAAVDGTREKPQAAWTPAQVVEFLEGKMGEGQFWVLCPDNDVSEEVDRRRMLWSANDAVLGRPPLSRWREEFKGQFAEWMAKK